MTSPRFYKSEWLAFLRPVDGVSALHRVRISGDEPQAVQRVVLPADGGDTESTLSHEEKMRRERMRQLSIGVTSFHLLRDGSFLFPQHGNVCRTPADGGRVDIVVNKELTGATGPCLDVKPWPSVQPCGRVVGASAPQQFVAFVQENELYVAAVAEHGADGEAHQSRCWQVTSGARESGTSHAVADYLAAEEFDRMDGFWWAPRGEFIAFQHTDDRHVPPFRIQHVGADPANSTEEEVHRYPFAGCANPRVRLGIADVRAVTRGDAGSEPPAFPVTWCDLGSNEDMYVVRVKWAGPAVLWVQLLNRAQTCLDLVQVDAHTGKAVLLIRETAPGAWINVHDVCEPLQIDDAASSWLLWASERSGFQHVYLYRIPRDAVADASQVAYPGPPTTVAAEPGQSGVAVCEAQLTSGDWVMEGLSHVVVEGPTVHAYCYGTRDCPIQRHLYCVTASRGYGEEAWSCKISNRLTVGAGMHAVTVSECGTYIADELSTLHHPVGLILWRCQPQNAAARLALREYETPNPVTSTPAVASSAETAGADASTSFSTKAIREAIVDFDDFGRYGGDAGMKLLCICSGTIPAGSSNPDGYEVAHEYLRILDGARNVKGSALGGALQRMVAPVVKPVSAASVAILESVSSVVSTGMEAISSGMDTVSHAVSNSMDAISTGIGPLRKLSLTPAHKTEDTDAPIDEASPLDAAPATEPLEHIDVPIPVLAQPPSSEQREVPAAEALPGVSASPPPPLAPLIVRIPLADCSEPMYGALLLPDPGKHGVGPYRTVISVYGGPHVQRVRHHWPTVMDARAQALREQGFLVAIVRCIAPPGAPPVRMVMSGDAFVQFDNRGSSRRGCAFERALNRRMGVGVYGHSYGGYMTLMCLARAPDTFSAGVSGAPVTDWAGYDTAYTERYMGTPADNADGYRDGCVVTHTAHIRGQLLLIHGLIDENVHARHSYRLISHLNANRVRYRFIAYPGERHGIRTPSERAHMDESTVAFFKQAL